MLRAAIIALALLLAVPVAVLAYGTGQQMAVSSQRDPVIAAVPTPSVSPTVSPTETAVSPSATPTTPTADDLALAVVRVVQLDEGGEPVCKAGSGTFLDAEGTILTNHHVISGSADCRYARLGIEVTTASDRRPELRYVAAAYAVSAEHDLAVLRVTSTIDGAPLADATPFLPLGDSDSLRLGDELQLIGYPLIGGSTITLTSGKVAGFTPEPDLEENAWIKTDGTISGGNSGGLAANAAGQLVGVPTLASSGDSSVVTDCRVVQDTNGDGKVDTDDTCIPIGGFVNALRPVNLALSMIEEARTADPIPVSQLHPDSTADAVLDPVIGPLQFAVAQDDQQRPVDPVDAFPSGLSTICGFFDYSGMVDGVGWEAIWSVDGEALRTSITGRPWSQGASGSYWACHQPDDGSAVEDGLWEVSIYVGGDQEPLRTGSIYVGDDHAMVDITTVNRLDETVCTLHLSPSLASTWEGDRLQEATLEPGYQVTRRVSAGVYDVRALDCDETVVAELFALDLAEGGTVILE